MRCFSPPSGMLSLALFVVLTACSQSESIPPQPTTNRSVVKMNDKGEASLVFAKAGLSASVKLKDYPAKQEEPTSFELRFWKTGVGKEDRGPFIDPGYPVKHPNIKLWMGGTHNHPSAPLKFAKTDDKGDVVYQVTNASFFMMGEWQIKFQLVNAAGKVVDEGMVIYNQP